MIELQSRILYVFQNPIEQVYQKGIIFSSAFPTLPISVEQLLG